MNIFLSLLIVYVVLVGTMYLLQRRLMYFPDRNIRAPEAYGLAAFDDIRLTSDDGTRLQAWYRKPDAGKPLILYFHGNASNLSDRVGQLGAFAKAGFGVLAVSYRGFGLSEGVPDEPGIIGDARAAMRYALAQGYEARRLVLYGESLGTGVAVRMASEFAPGILALQAPYMSVVGRAAEIYWFVPVRLLIRDKFESLALLRNLNVPTLIFHGELDSTIPVAHGRAMLEAAAGAKNGVFYPNVGHTEFDPTAITVQLSDFIARHLP